MLLADKLSLLLAKVRKSKEAKNLTRRAMVQRAPLLSDRCGRFIIF